MILAAGDFFPGWMMWTSIAFSGGALGLFVFGSRKPKAKATVAPPPVMAPLDAPAPPPPLVPVASAPMSADDPNARRRAGFRRVGNSVEVIVCDAEFKETPRRGWVVDRSRHGLRLSLLEKFEAGTVLQVRPTTAPDGAPWLAVEVRNAKPGDQSNWEIGCKFASEPSLDVLLMFG
jgi:hypothetical protein